MYMYIYIHTYHPAHLAHVPFRVLFGTAGSHFTLLSFQPLGPKLCHLILNMRLNDMNEADMDGPKPSKTCSLIIFVT